MVHNLRTMNFLEFAVFVEVVRCGGISAAAEQLHLAKSGVSTVLRRLEDRLNVKLLERNSRRIALTAEGALLLPKVESLLAEGEHLLREAEQGLASPQGMVRIAATPEFGSMAVNSLVPEVRKRFPELRLTVKLAYGKEDLQDPSFDFAIRIGRVEDENLVARKVGGSHRLLVASPNAMSQISVKKLDDLTLAPCLIFSSTQLESIWTLQHLETQKEQSVVVSSHFAVQSLGTLLQLCEQGEGIAMLPEFLVRRSLAQGKLVNVLPELQSREINVNLVYRSGMDRIMRVKTVLDIAREVLPPLLSKP